MNNIKTRKRKGFTLVELIFVILIIAILATLIFSGGKRTSSSAKATVAQGDFHTFELASKQLLLEHPEYIKLQSTSPNFMASRL